MPHRPNQHLVGLGAGVYVVTPDQKLLLVEQERNGVRDWGGLGGALEAGESIEQCAVREAYEESGLRVRLVRLLSVDEFWHAGVLEGVGFVFLAEPATWPQVVTLPESDGATLFHRYRWVARDELAVFEGLSRLEICATIWPADLSEPLRRRLEFDS